MAKTLSNAFELPDQLTLIYFLNRSLNPLTFQEGLDLALATSAMGQDVVLLFYPRALALFNPEYHPPSTRDLQKNLKALSLYGLEHLYTLEPEQNHSLPSTVQAITQDQHQTLLNQAERVITF